MDKQNLDKIINDCNFIRDYCMKELTLKGGMFASEFMQAAATWNYQNKDRAFEKLRGIK